MEAQAYQAPQSNLMIESVYCRNCAAPIAATAPTCPKCGAPQNLNGASKVAAGLLAMFLGGFGIHRFYLGQWWGLFYLLFFWTAIPGLIAFIEGIVFLCTNDAKWLAKYGHRKGGIGLVLALVGFFVIIPMLGILAAVAIPAYQDYKERAAQHQQQHP